MLDMHRHGLSSWDFSCRWRCLIWHCFGWLQETLERSEVLVVFSPKDQSSSLWLCAVHLFCSLTVPSLVFHDLSGFHAKVSAFLPQADEFPWQNHGKKISTVVQTFPYGEVIVPITEVKMIAETKYVMTLWEESIVSWLTFLLFFAHKFLPHVCSQKTAFIKTSILGGKTSLNPLSHHVSE